MCGAAAASRALSQRDVLIVALVALATGAWAACAGEPAAKSDVGAALADGAGSDANVDADGSPDAADAAPDDRRGDANAQDGAGFDAAADTATLPATQAGPTWVLLGSPAIDSSGHSLPVAVTVSTADRFLAIRVRPEQPNPNAGWCYGIDDIRLPDGQPWLEPLTGGLGASTVPFGSQRALPQHGYGVFVLPNDGVSDLPEGLLTFRVVLRDCRFDLPAKRVPDGRGRGRYAGLPKTVWVEVAREPAFDAKAPAQLELRIAVAKGSGFPEQGLQDDPGWKAAWARAQARFETAGVALQLGRVAVIQAPANLEYGPGKTAVLDAVFDAALTALTDAPSERSLRFVPIVLVACLVRDAPLAQGPQAYSGQAPRIPGGAPFGPSAGGVFVARSNCLHSQAPLDGAALGDVLAHELGHSLGLLHSDTALGGHRAEAGAQDIMSAGSSLAGAGGFSPKQRVALRRHFSVSLP